VCDRRRACSGLVGSVTTHRMRDSIALGVRAGGPDKMRMWTLVRRWRCG
jgi:hypothetical protein